jgi:hypothetical protein
MWASEGQFGDDFVRAEMGKAFIKSDEHLCWSGCSTLSSSSAS